MIEDCPFCGSRVLERAFYVDDLVCALWDGFPVSVGHALVVTRRHVASWFETSQQERLALLSAIDIARDKILESHDPQGFNIGVNVGAAAGQTIFHLHVHLIPRYLGDVPDPRGGVRYVIPERANYIAKPLWKAEIKQEDLPSIPQPHEVQLEALEKLEATRLAGNSAGLVVLATGLGKTWLSAFDSNRPIYKRILFVAHREEILSQAMMTFRKIRPTARFGHYTGKEKKVDAEILFASVQTLGKKSHLDNFDPQTFDYIVVDEFHHAAASTYRRLIDHFRPKFLLGLTATPERTDGGDLLALCQENLVYRCDLVDGIRRGLLSPFHYYGVPDEVDYSNIPWRSNRFDEEALTRAVATRSRAQNALEQYQKRAARRTLAFCCSQLHANFMADFFQKAGVKAVAVHSGEGSAPRERSLEELERGDIQVIFAVDVFNEGLDVPAIDTVMMLRPTESRILWLQQLGRGLRKTQNKTHLTVIDYIGNHRTFLLKPQTLLGLGSGDSEIAAALKSVQAGTLALPPGCEVNYELEAIDIIKGLLRAPNRDEALKEYFEDFKELHGVRPLAIEAFHEGYNPRSARVSFGSWLGFVKSMGGLSASQEIAFHNARDFLSLLETTPMTKSYKMLVLLAMLNRSSLPGAMSLTELSEAVREMAQRVGWIKRDLGVELTERELEKLLEEHPIRVWTDGKGMGGIAYFDYEGKIFKSNAKLSGVEALPLAELIREIVEWRLAEYAERNTSSSH